MNDSPLTSPDSEDVAFAIDFGSLGNSDNYKVSGWQAPETGFTWTSGNLSTLVFPRPEHPGRYVLELRVNPFIWKDVLPSQKLIVFVNDDEIERFEVTSEATLHCEVPWSVFLKQDVCSLELCLPDAAKPQEVSGVPDVRSLALALDEIRLIRISLDTPGRVRQWPDDLTPANEASLTVDKLVPKTATDMDLKGLMLMFESLGEDCEFGLVQRRCGAEPLGLLRFSSTPLPKLLAALEARFDGLGRPDKIEVKLSANGREYMISDKRFGLFYHAWVLAGEKTPEEIHARELSRLPFLIRKLTEDLTEGSKIFVYRGMTPLAESDVQRLAAAMRAYGPTTLLWVEVAGEDAIPGAVEEISPALYKGYIKQFAPANNAHDFSLDAWVDVCRNAVRLRQTLRAFAGYS